MPNIIVKCAPREKYNGFYAIQRHFPPGETGPIEVTHEQLAELKREPDSLFLTVTAVEYTPDEQKAMAQSEAEKAAAKAKELREAAAKAQAEAEALAKAAAKPAGK